MNVQTYHVREDTYPREWYAETFKVGSYRLIYICLGYRMIRIEFGRKG